MVLLASGAPPTSRTIATPELRYALLTVALSSARQPTVQRCATLPECAVREDAAVLAEREEQRRAAWAPGGCVEWAMHHPPPPPPSNIHTISHSPSSATQGLVPLNTGQILVFASGVKHFTGDCFSSGGYAC